MRPAAVVSAPLLASSRGTTTGSSSAGRSAPKDPATGSRSDARLRRLAPFLALALLAGCGVKGDPISPSEAAAEAAEEVAPVAEEQLPGT